MAGEAVLRCTAKGIGAFVLPWWPSDVTSTQSGWNYSELERPGMDSLALPSTRTGVEYTLGFVLRQQDHRAGVGDRVDHLQRIAASTKPSQLILGDRVLGLFRLEPPSLTVIEFATDGSPSVVDVQLTLKAASDAQITVGLIRPIKGRLKNAARKKR